MEIKENISDVNGIIRERSLFSLLYPDSNNPRTKPETTPTTQNTKLLQASGKEHQDFMTILHKLELLRNENESLHAILDLQLMYGLRISEVLGIHGKDISTTGHILIHGLKGSNDRIVIPIHSATYYQKYSGVSGKIFQSYSRNYVYRQYKRIGIGRRFQGRMNSAVTHYLRHLFVSGMKSELTGINTISMHIGHKRVSNTELYNHE